MKIKVKEEMLFNNLNKESSKYAKWHIQMLSEELFQIKLNQHC